MFARASTLKRGRVQPFISMVGRSSSESITVFGPSGGVRSLRDLPATHFNRNEPTIFNFIDCFGSVPVVETLAARVSEEALTAVETGRHVFTPEGKYTSFGVRICFEGQTRIAGRVAGRRRSLGSVRPFETGELRFQIGFARGRRDVLCAEKPQKSFAVKEIPPAKNKRRILSGSTAPGDGMSTSSCDYLRPRHSFISY